MEEQDQQPGPVGLVGGNALPGGVMMRTATRVGIAVRREGSGEPSHGYKEAHTRIGEGNQVKAIASAGHHARVEVDTGKPVPVTRFLK